MKCYPVIGAFTLAAAINRFRKLNNHPQANTAIINLVNDVARHLPEEERKEFTERCMRNLNDPEHQK